MGAVYHCEEIIDHLLDFLEKSVPVENVRWSGQVYQLTHGELGRRTSSLAVLCMVVERWLPEIECVELLFFVLELNREKFIARWPPLDRLNGS